MTRHAFWRNSICSSFFVGEEKYRPATYFCFQKKEIAFAPYTANQTKPSAQNRRIRFFNGFSTSVLMHCAEISPLGKNWPFSCSTFHSPLCQASERHKTNCWQFRRQGLFVLGAIDAPKLSMFHSQPSTKENE